MDAILVLHGKRSVTLADADGVHWRRTLIEPLVAARDRSNLDLMLSDTTVGLIGAAACRSTFLGANAATLALLTERLDITEASRSAPFVAGSMFIIRPSLMGELRKALNGLEFLTSDPTAGRGEIDGRLEHAVERAYGAIVFGRNLRIVWRDVRVTEVELDLAPAIASARPPNVKAKSDCAISGQNDPRLRSGILKLVRWARNFFKQQTLGQIGRAPSGQSTGTLLSRRPPSNRATRTRAMHTIHRSMAWMESPAAMQSTRHHRRLHRTDPGVGAPSMVAAPLIRLYGSISTTIRLLARRGRLAA